MVKIGLGLNLIRKAIVERREKIEYKGNQYYAITTNDGRFICETFDNLSKAVEVWSHEYVGRHKVVKVTGSWVN